MLSDIYSDFSPHKKSQDSSFIKLDDADHFIMIPNSLVGDNRRSYLHLGTTNIYNVLVDTKGEVSASYERLTAEDEIMPFANQCSQIYC